MELLSSQCRAYKHSATLVEHMLVIGVPAGWRYLFRLLRLAVSVYRTAKSKNSAQLSETYACPEVRTEGLGAPIRSTLLMVG